MQVYPNEKIIELNAYMNNFNKDINGIKEIFNKLNELVIRGININEATNSLNSQIQNWENTMNDLLESFTQNIKTLKKLDDRIDDSNNIDNIDIFECNGTFSEIWNYLYIKYLNILNNLENDINILNNIIDSISNYTNLGNELLDASNIIKNKIDSIIDSKSTSLKDLDNIINKIKDISKKNLSNEEIGNISNININYFAVYSTIICNETSLILCLNNNLQINWNPIIDGSNILRYITRAIIDTHSPLYNKTIGNGVFYTNSTTPYKYGYYGLSKDNMIGFYINNNITHGSIYEDIHGYQRNINIFYGSLIEENNISLLDKFINSIKDNGSIYTSGNDSIKKIYIIFSLDKIIDFSNISFIGDNNSDK